MQTWTMRLERMAQVVNGQPCDVFVDGQDRTAVVCIPKGCRRADAAERIILAMGQIAAYAKTISDLPGGVPSAVDPVVTIQVVAPLSVLARYVPPGGQAQVIPQHAAPATPTATGPRRRLEP